VNRGYVRGGLRPARSLAALLLVAPLAALPLVANAATVTIHSVDSAGEGFNDTSPATPVGGNLGTTLGEQRMNVFKKAAQLWGDALISVPPIVVAASFAPLPCSTNQIMLGQAAFTTSREGTPGAPPNLWVPIALANALAGTDLNGAEEEIEAMFNGGLSQCSMNLQNWYYGLDGMAGDDIDLLSVVLHEFGHGLGFASVLDPSDGVAPMGLLDVFTANVYDNATNKAWTDMTDSQRAASAQDARHLVWSGRNVLRQMPQVLAMGSPTLSATPSLSGLTGHVTEGEFGPYPVANPVSGLLKVGKVVSPCNMSGSLTNAIVLFAATNLCPPVQIAAMAQQSGAVGALFEDPVGTDPPFAVSVLPSVQNYGPVKIPVASVSSHDLTALSAAGSNTMLSLGAAGDQRVGADTMGRTDLFASAPVLGASTLSHWDPLARPDLLMEPQIASKAPHDQRMELAAFRDIGWKTTCGNGATDSGEQCDLGDENGAAGASCNADCTKAQASTGSGGSVGTGSGGATTGGSGGQSGSGGTSASGGVTAAGTGGVSTGGSTALATGGTSATGSGGIVGSGGTAAGSGGSGAGPGETGGSSSGCSCQTGSGAPAQGLSVLLVAGLLMLRRRRLR
jgi:MYXO-CTERM domain-containing protein